MKTFLSHVLSFFLLLGALYCVSFGIDAMHLIKERFRGPAFLDVGRVPSTSSSSATDVTRLQQACGEDAESECTLPNQGNVVMRSGLGLKANSALRMGVD